MEQWEYARAVTEIMRTALYTRVTRDWDHLESLLDPDKAATQHKTKRLN
jgi:hypothetical protein